MHNERLSLIQAIADSLPVGVWVAQAPSGELVYANRMFGEIMGMDAIADAKVGGYSEPYGLFDRDGNPYPEEGLPFVRCLRERSHVTVDNILVHRRDGRKVHLRATARPVFDEAGAIVHVAVAFDDVSREVAAQEANKAADLQQQRTRRLESVAQLAGGIAHDFNNLLTSMKMHVALLAATERDADKLDDLRRIDELTSAAAHLTRSLLGFARRGKYQSERIDLHEVTRDHADVWGTTLGAAIRTRLELLAAHSHVAGDATQLTQVLMNLVRNARDAMPDGGELTLTTSNAMLDAELAGRRNVRPGAFLLLDVADTGRGIPLDLRDRVFEPYFTTKGAGSVPGTGLGLATVLGIAEAHGGWCEVRDSDAGAVIRVALPVAAPAAPARAPTPVAGLATRVPTGTILIVDDEPSVRHVIARALQGCGYRTVLAADGIEAVEMYRAHAHRIDCVLLDMVMPRMGGKETYLALRAEQPTVVVLLMTGYALNEDAQETLNLGAVGLIQKPVALETLREAVLDAIGQPPPARA